MKKTAILIAAAALASAAFAGCSKPPKDNDKPGSGIPGVVTDIPGHDSLAQDTTPKEEPRLMAPEVYLRSYLAIFGGVSPQEVEDLAKKDNLFKQWSDYLGLVGLPDHATDTIRQPETNALMLGTFERLGIALCDRALERDWKADPPVAVDKRAVFAFEQPKGVATQAEFEAGFDVMHRTFLGYPAKMARTDRVARFYGLYNDVVKAHNTTTSPKLTAAEAGWAAVCYGLVRHPELHLY